MHECHPSRQRRRHHHCPPMYKRVTGVHDTLKRKDLTDSPVCSVYSNVKTHTESPVSLLYSNVKTLPPHSRDEQPARRPARDAYSRGSVDHHPPPPRVHQMEAPIGARGRHRRSQGSCFVTPTQHQQKGMYSTEPVAQPPRDTSKLTHGTLAPGACAGESGQW